MKLISENLEILFTNEKDEQLDSIFQNVDDLDNMSETRLYPEGLPLEMSFKIIKDGEVAGQIKLNRIRWFNRKAELSIAIKKEFQNSGVGTEALKSILNYSFNKMNIHRIEAEVMEYNKASIKLVERLGFIEEGKLREAKYKNGKYWNIIRYGLLRKEFTEIKK